jgi:hypothetical protein
MAASFLLSLLAGLLAINAEPLVRRALRAIDDDMTLEPDELRVLTFGLALLVAAMVTAIMSADSSAYMAVSGGLLGYFGRIFATTYLSGRREDDADPTFTPQSTARSADARIDDGVDAVPAPRGDDHARTRQ